VISGWKKKGQEHYSKGRPRFVLEPCDAGFQHTILAAHNPDTWMYHCHVNDHIAAGMTAFYRVETAE
jgi:hypothetical protein